MRKILDIANKYKDEIEKCLMEKWYDEKYKYYFASNWRSKLEFDDNDWNNHQFVSLDQNNKIIGLIGYHIERAHDCVSCLWIINFSNNRTTFGIDVAKVLKDMFTKFNYRKLEFTVVIGNPIEKSYDRLIHKFGGRIVGIYKQHVKLIDSKYYDEKLYEIFREDYLKATGKHDELNIKVSYLKNNLNEFHDHIGIKE